ncbi:MAG: hypothetical protein PHD66_02240 [Eubacteriales bacterium]|nr:hypothetical protein [Eubacteriales bacterium]
MNFNANLTTCVNRIKRLFKNSNRDELEKCMADMSTFLNKQSSALIEYDDQLVRRLIEKVTYTRYLRINLIWNLSPA